MIEKEVFHGTLQAMFVKLEVIIFINDLFSNNFIYMYLVKAECNRLNLIIAIVTIYRPYLDDIHVQQISIAILEKNLVNDIAPYMIYL